MCIVTDDLGVLVKGTQIECCNGLVTWLKSDEADLLYRKKELVGAIARCNELKNEYIESEEVLGFTIEYVEED